MLNSEELKAIRKRASEATPGPWFAAATDDDMCMNALFVTTEPTPFEHSNTHGMSPGDKDSKPEKVVAITLLQSPPLAYHEAQRWDEDTLFIAHAREDVPALIETVEALQQYNEQLNSLAGLQDMKMDKMESFIRLIVQHPNILNTPIPQLGNKTPRTLILTDRMDDLTSLIYYLEQV